MTTFGCGRCYGEDAAAAWEHWRAGRHTDAVLVEQSHLRTSLTRCRECSQQFVWIFAESIDWVDGEDPQYNRVIPVSPAEAARLVTLGADADLEAIADLDRRRHLARDWPAGASATTYWARGPLILPPDVG